MEIFVLTIHLILTLLLIGAVLLQRSEGGALGIGGGGGGSVMSGRGAATALQKATWGLAAAFIATSIILTLFATQRSQDRGLIDRGDPALIAPQNGAGAPGEGGLDLRAPGIAPPSGGDATLTPPTIGGDGAQNDAATPPSAPVEAEPGIPAPPSTGAPADDTLRVPSQSGG